jgi:hypothetical protein
MKVYSVTDFGAIPNGDGLQTEFFQKAIDTAFLAGGGEVVVPAGSYTIGGIRLRSNIVFRIKSGATIVGTRDVAEYWSYRNDAVEPYPAEYITDKNYVRPQFRNNDFEFLKEGGRWNNALIRIDFAQNVSVVGEEGAIIDGKDPYDPLNEEFYRGPHGVTIAYSKNVTFKGFTIQNTGNWAFNIRHSQNAKFEDITVNGGHDGVHMTTCENIIVKNCNFYTGDDCVAGIGNLNVYVSDCIMNTACSAFRFGGTNLYAERCKVFGPAKYFFRGELSLEDKIKGGPAKVGRNNTLSIFTYYADQTAPIPYLPGNIQMVDFEAKNVDRFLHYNFSGNEVWQLAVPLKSIRFENVKAENVALPLTAYGDKDVKIDLELKNVDVSFGVENIPFIQGAHFDKLTLENVKINGKISSLVKSWTDGGKMTFDNVTGDLPEQKVIITDEKFVCNPI